MDWMNRVADPDVLASWELLSRAARSALPKAGPPDGMTVGDIIMTVMEVAQAKGLIRLRVPDDGDELVDAEVTPLGVPVLSHLVPLAGGSLEDWGAAVRAVDASAAHANPAELFAALDAQRSAPAPDLEPVGDVSGLWPHVAMAVRALRRGTLRMALIRDGAGGGLEAVAFFSPATEVEVPPEGLPDWSPPGSDPFFVSVGPLVAAAFEAARAMGLIHLAEVRGQPYPVASPGEDATLAVLNSFHPASDTEHDVSGLLALLDRLANRALD